jgi:hypothetical protein
MCPHVLPLRTVLTRDSFLAGRLLHHASDSLGSLCSGRDDKLAVDLALRIESQGDFTATQQALEHQVGYAVNARYEIWRTAELVMAPLRDNPYSDSSSLRGLLLFSPLRPTCLLGGTDSGDGSG